MTFKVTSNPSLSKTYQKDIDEYSCCGTTTETTELNAYKQEISVSQQVSVQILLLEKKILKKLLIFLVDDHHHFIMIAENQIATPLKRSVPDEKDLK